jgi:predicted PurR-regulated permease PerM
VAWSLRGIPIVSEERHNRGLNSDTAARAATWGLVWLAIIILAFLAWQLRIVLAILFLAVLIAAAMRRPVNLLDGWGVPRAIAVVLSYLLLLGVVALLVWIVVPPLVEQAASFLEDVPALVDRLLRWLRDTAAPILPGDTVDNVISGVQDNLRAVLPDVSSALQLPLVIVGVLVNVVVILFLSAFLILDGKAIAEAILGYVSPQRRERVRGVGEAILGKLGSYVSGQLLVMAVTGAGSAVGMLLIGVPYVLPMGFLAFLTEAIPLAGPWIAGIPIVLLAFLESPLQGVLMSAWIIALQQLEGVVLIPVVQNKAIQVSPTIVLLGVFAGGSLAGVLGALIAIPLVAVTQVIMSEVVLPARRQTWQGADRPSDGSEPQAG